MATSAEREAYRQRLDLFLASRDVGSALTLDALRHGVRVEAVIGAAEDVAAYADEALAIVNEEYRPRLDCREGCSFCCRKPGVLATIPEFLARKKGEAQASGSAGSPRREAAALSGR